MRLNRLCSLLTCINCKSAADQLKGVADFSMKRIIARGRHGPVGAKNAVREKSSYQERLSNVVADEALATIV